MKELKAVTEAINRVATALESILEVIKSESKTDKHDLYDRKFKELK